MSVCKKSAYLNKLGSNIVYVGRSFSKYSCPDSFCAELGSPMRPSHNLEDALIIIQKKFSKETPVTISFSPGNYELETSVKLLTIPQNVVALICSEGSVKLKNNLSIKNVGKLDIQNIDLIGDLEIIGDGNHKGKVTWKNGNLYGKYNYITKDQAIQLFSMKNVDQFVSDELDGLYDNEIMVSGKGVATIHIVNCLLESKFKGKVDVSETGILNRYTEKCTKTSGGETTNLSGNGVMDDLENQNKTYHIETDNGSQKDHWILNLFNNAKIRWEKNKSTHQGEFSDGCFWYNVHGQDDTMIEKIHDSCVYKISGLGGFLSLYGKDQCKIIVRKQNDLVEASKNKELRPLYVRNLSDSCSLNQKISNTEFSTASHYYENIQNGKSEFIDHDDRVQYLIAGYYCTNSDNSSHHSNWESLNNSCDPEIGYIQKTIMNHNSSKSIKLSNSNTKLCNDGKQPIFNLEQRDNTESNLYEYNNKYDYILKDYLISFDDQKEKPCVRLEVINDSSKCTTTLKSNNIKLIAGQNCDGVRRTFQNGDSNCPVVEYDQNYEMIFYDENAIAYERNMNDNSIHHFIGNRNIRNQTGGRTLFRHIQNGNSHYIRESSYLTLQHNSNENSKTIEEIMNENATSSCTDNFSIQKSDGTLFSLITNGNSSTNNKRKNGNYCGRKQLGIRQKNDNSTQIVRADGVELNGTLFSNSTNDQTNIIYNGTDHIGAINGENINLDFVNSTMEGTIDTRKSNILMKACRLRGILHAVDCDSVESLNCLHQSSENTSPIFLDNTKTCNILFSNIETSTSIPHIKTNADENFTLNLKGVNFVDTVEENSSLACIEADGKGKMICEVGSCTSKRSKFISSQSEHQGRSKTIFSRNCQFGTNGLDPTVDGELIETSTSLVVQNGSLTSTPNDDCVESDTSSIDIIPRNLSDIPFFSMYYCLGLPQYDSFVSSSISFKDIIDSYQSKEVNSGCFTATSVRCMTDDNCVPIDGMYIMIDGIRTPNDKNALQTDQEGNIINRNIKDALFMEKYHITKIDPRTKISIAQLGGNLQYTDGSGTGSTTCIPRLIFPIHYASGEWSSLKNGFIEWNYDNTKETNYKRELRFFTENSTISIPKKEPPKFFIPKPDVIIGDVISFDSSGEKV